MTLSSRFFDNNRKNETVVQKRKKESDIDGLTSSQSRAEQTIRGGRHEYLRLNPPSPPHITRPQAETGPP